MAEKKTLRQLQPTERFPRLSLDKSDRTAATFQRIRITADFYTSPRGHQKKSDYIRRYFVNIVIIVCFGMYQYIILTAFR